GKPVAVAQPSDGRRTRTACAVYEVNDGCDKVERRIRLEQVVLRPRNAQDGVIVEQLKAGDKATAHQQILEERYRNVQQPSEMPVAIPGVEAQRQREMKQYGEEGNLDRK